VDAGEGARRVVVVGLGNVLTTDDAFGPTVIAHLEAAYESPPRVELVDGGTPGLDLAVLLEDTRGVILVDTVASAGEPGELRRYDKRILLGRELAPRTNPHAPGVHETLHLLELLGQAPDDVLLVGVVPGEVDIGVGLSTAVSAAVPAAVRAVVTELERLGIPPARRSPPRTPRMWWTTGNPPPRGGTGAASHAHPPEYD
jgi:hydrogenase maturation protease